MAFQRQSLSTSTDAQAIWVSEPTTLRSRTSRKGLKLYYLSIELTDEFPIAYSMEGYKPFLFVQEQEDAAWAYMKLLPAEEGIEPIDDSETLSNMIEGQGSLVYIGESELPGISQIQVVQMDTQPGWVKPRYQVKLY